MVDEVVEYWPVDCEFSALGAGYAPARGPSTTIMGSNIATVPFSPSRLNNPAGWSVSPHLGSGDVGRASEETTTMIQDMQDDLKFANYLMV